MRAKVGAASVAVERGDITDWDVDAIVNAANSTLTMGAGVAAAIKRKGGVLIEEEAVRQGPIEVGEAVLTPGGNLAATHVIHAVAMGPDLKTNPDTIARTTWKMIENTSIRPMTDGKLHRSESEALGYLREAAERLLAEKLGIWKTLGI